MLVGGFDAVLRCSRRVHAVFKYLKAPKFSMSIDTLKSIDQEGVAYKRMLQWRTCSAFYSLNDQLQ